VNDQPELSPDELRAIAEFAAAAQQVIQTAMPVIQAAFTQMTSLYSQLQASGLIDEHGRFVGGQQGDFVLCPQPEPTDGDDHA
jgi:hypothetical protein